MGELSALSVPIMVLIVGVAIWFLIKRPVEQWQKEITGLKHDVRDLRERELAELKEQQKKAMASRGKLYQDDATIRQTFVHKEECDGHRAAQRDLSEQMHDTAVQLARASEQINQTQKRQDVMAEQLQGVSIDIATTAQQVDDMKKA